MRIFRASQELIDILLKNGFEDKTEKEYPEHFRRMKESGYKPNSIKRKFSKHSHKDYILFDYTTIVPVFNKKSLPLQHRITLTEDELKSFITFYYLPSIERQAWINSYRSVVELHLEYKDICEHPGLSKSGLDMRVKKIFERVVI